MHFNDEEVEDDKCTVLSENHAHCGYSVRYDLGFSGETFVQIEEYVAGSTGPYAMDPLTWKVDLPPREALALLSWLRQEEETLKKLVQDEVQTA